VSYEQGFAWWPFEDAGVESGELLTAAAEIGFRVVDFLPEELWENAKDVGLGVSIIDGHQPLEVGFNRRAQHRELYVQVRQAIELAAGAQIPFVAVAPGDRTAHTDRDGLRACVEGLLPLAEEAEAADVCLLVEPLNSKVDHPGHECDLTQWGAELIDAVDSLGLRLLYDFYHAQVMEGDLLRTVQTNLHRIAHLHTAGVPGRNELDDGQEVNWPGIARGLRQMGYDGYVSHELIPRGEAIAALRQAFDAFAPEHGS
jgi:hydroxypyruvate isomerase